MPQLIRVETVAQLSTPKAFVVAGHRSARNDLPAPWYELVYKDHLVVVDASLNADVARTMSAPILDSAACAQKSIALARAALIVVTHEHPAHVDSLLAQPDPIRPTVVARLTRAQVAELTEHLTSGPFA